ncbi:hypothetical protein [Streptomyces netropsis]|uniref:Uncharacterized protein n=1 Tax=Streptomyces netropsis TaxID=55404 RepID=A0A7W7L7Q3_STRNE|nr:hypothetical protein [Streptomyces netropsis]MBB4885190.1 hypothetical protein [Streptomyces netropsis]GGR27420.1 hypothetical protein GCM10010219_35380 [Streptomyces netropsis]
MTDRAQDERITFKIWNPIVIQDGAAVWCEMDVTSIGDCLLNEGDGSLAEKFVEEIAAPNPTIISWQVERFRSQYYSDYPRHGDWRGRLALTWRMRIDFSGTVRTVGHKGSGPFGVNAWDSTFDADTLLMDQAIERCIVICEIEGPSDVTRLENCVQDIRTIDYPALSGVPARIDLGEVALPADVERVHRVISACEAQGLRTNWAGH